MRVSSQRQNKCRWTPDNVTRQQVYSKYIYSCIQTESSLDVKVLWMLIVLEDHSGTAVKKNCWQLLKHECKECKQASRDVPYTSCKSDAGCFLSPQSGRDCLQNDIPYSTGSLMIITLPGCLLRSQHCISASTVPLALPLPKSMSTGSVGGPLVYIMLVKHL